MSLPKQIEKANTGANEFRPGYKPEMFPELPQLETRSPQLMALDIEILKADVADLTARLLVLENKNGDS